MKNNDNVFFGGLYKLVPLHLENTTAMGHLCSTTTLHLSIVVTHFTFIEKTAASVILILLWAMLPLPL